MRLEIAGCNLFWIVMGREPWAILCCKSTERLSKWSSCGVFFFTLQPVSDIPHDVEPVPRRGAHYKKCCKSILSNTSCHIDRAISKLVKPCRVYACRYSSSPLIYQKLKTRDDGRIRRYHSRPELFCSTHKYIFIYIKYSIIYT